MLLCVKQRILFFSQGHKGSTLTPSVQNLYILSILLFSFYSPLYFWCKPLQIMFLRLTCREHNYWTEFAAPSVLYKSILQNMNIPYLSVKYSTKTQIPTYFKCFMNTNATTSWISRFIVFSALLWDFAWRTKQKLLPFSTLDSPRKGLALLAWYGHLLYKINEKEKEKMAAA